MTVTRHLGLCTIGIVLLSTAGTALSDPPSGQPATAALQQQTEPPPAQTSTENPPATPPAAQPEPKPEAGPAATSDVAPIKPDDAMAILGKKVHGRDGKDVMGPVIDVLVDGDGRPRAVIIDFGGFLGVGSRKIAVDWQLLKFKPADHDAPIVLGMDRAQIQTAPEYKDSAHTAEVVEPPSAPPVAPDAGHQAN